MLNNAQTIKLFAPVMCISAPDYHHGWKGISKDKSDVMVVHFADVCEPIKELCKKGFYNFSVTNEFIRQFKDIFDLLESLDSNNGWRYGLYIERELINLSLLVLDSVGYIPEQNNHNLYSRQVDKAISIAQDQFHQQLSVAEVAKEVGVSSCHLRRVFQKVLNKTPSEAFREIKLEVARDLLLNTSYSITYISNHCGFTSSGVFSRLFKQQYDRTPRDYRKAKGWLEG